MTKKELIRAIGFFLVICCLVTVLCDMFESSNGRSSQALQTYYDFEEDTVDVLVYGTSGIDRYYIAGKAFEEYGLTAYPVAVDGFPAWLYSVTIEETLKYQSPKLVVIDMRSFTTNYTFNSQKFENRTRRLTNILPFFSPNYLKGVKRSYDIIKEHTDKASFETMMSYYFPFIRYHSMWEEEGEASFDELKDPKSSVHGFFTMKSRSLQTTEYFEDTEITDERKDLHPVCEEYIYELLDYFDKNADYEVLFVDTPRYLNGSEVRRMNTLCDILDERGYKYVRFPLDETIYDKTKDFIDDGHVNYYGAEKFTPIFAKYLVENYDLPDRRDDQRCVKDWVGPYDTIKKRIASWEKVQLS